MKFNQDELIVGLKRETAYPHTISYINVIETHISWIILTGRIAYKIKKAVRFGKVLDFSNIHLRKKFCQKELRLNKSFCGDMYLCMVKIIKSDGNYKLINLDEKGIPIEYAVKMKEFPQKHRLDNLLASNKVNSHILGLLIDELVKFHNLSPTNSTISKYGSTQIMIAKIRENFRTISKTLKIDSIFEEKLSLFVRSNRCLFEERRKRYRIRDIHGDLYLKNIFYVGGKFYMYDRIEFNDSLRYADIAEDVAHLAMDIHYHQREDLQSYFISNYIKKSNDTTLIRIIYFMMCYKACVRAKVSLFRSVQITDKNQKVQYIKEAKEHFRLAKKYIKML
jgi:aminoglycoside phosphotransferase family enzyme